MLIDRNTLVMRPNLNSFLFLRMEQGKINIILVKTHHPYILQMLLKNFRNLSKKCKISPGKEIQNNLKSSTRSLLGSRGVKDHIKTVELDVQGNLVCLVRAMSCYFQLLYCIFYFIWNGYKAGAQSRSAPYPLPPPPNVSLPAPPAIEPGKYMNNTFALLK